MPFDGHPSSSKEVKDHVQFLLTFTRRIRKFAENLPKTS